MDRLWKYLSILLLVLWIAPVWSATKTLVDTDSVQTLSNKTILGDAFSITATGSTTARTLGARFAEVYNVKDYGALGNDSADDTTGIQAALTACATARGGVVVFPFGAYRHTALTLAPASSQIHCSLVGLGGVGAFGVRLKYTGSGGTALTISNDTRYVVENLRFEDIGTGAVGLQLNSLSAGSNHGQSPFKNVFLTGFTNDLVIGTTGDLAASEITFAGLEVDSATIGILIQGSPTSNNSLNFTFLRLAASGNGTVLKYSGDSDDNKNVIVVDGASLSNNTLEFDLATPAHLRLADIYAEQSGNGQLLKSGSATPSANVATPTFVELDNVMLNYPSSPSNFVALFHQPGQYTIRNSTLQTGSIQLGGFDGGGGARKAALTVQDSVIASASARIQYLAGSNTIWLVRHRSSGNANTEALNTDDDRTYLIQTTGTEVNLDYFNWSASAATLATVTGPTPPTVAFGSLGSPPNGTTVYCSDCTFANPCAGSGTGAIAKRLNGAWRCD